MDTTLADKHIARWERAERIAARILPRRSRSTDACEDIEDWIIEAFMKATRSIDASPAGRALSEHDREARWDCYFVRALRWAFLTNLRGARRREEAILAYAHFDRLGREQREWRRATHPERVEELGCTLEALSDMDRAMLLDQLRGIRLIDRGGMWGLSTATMSRYANRARKAARRLILARHDNDVTEQVLSATKAARRSGLRDVEQTPMGGSHA